MKITKSFFLVIFFLLCSCGTDTGNPTLNHNEPVGSIGDGADSKTSFVEDFVVLNCSLVKQCHESVNLKHCFDSLFEDKKMVITLGFKPNEFSNLGDLYASEKNGDVSVNSAKKENCFYEIKNTSCESDNVRKAYQPNDTMPFKKTYKIVPQSCDGALSFVSGIYTQSD